MSLDGKVGLIRPVSQASADFADVPTILNAGAGDGRLVVPGGSALLRAEFFPSGGDLLIVMPDGSRIFVLDYYAAPLPTTLMTEGGAALPYDLVNILAGPHAPGQYAQSETGLQAAPIGRVDESVGDATATRVDGTTVTLTKNSPVFEGDILETGAGGAVALVFIDETEFSLGEEGRMVLDELIFDSASLEGSSTFSVVQGVFVFVSGEIAAHNPDEMMVRTPVATLGIRGTKVAGRAATEGELNTVTMMPEDGGAVTGAITVSTQSATITLNTAYQTTAVSSVFDAPADPVTLSPQQAGGLYGAVDRLLPASNADQLAANDAAAGARTVNAEGGADGEGAGSEEGQAEAGEDGPGGDDAGIEEEALLEGEALEGEPLEEGVAGPEEGAAGGDEPELSEFAGDAPGPGENIDGLPLAGAPEGPSSEDIAAAELAASDAAFDALESALAGGATLDSAMQVAMVAGAAAYESLADFGPEGPLVEGAFGADGELGAADLGFGPEGFADTLQDGVTAPGPEGPGPGDGELINPEQFSAEFGTEFGTEFGDAFGAIALYDGAFGDSFLGGDFISEPIFDGGFVEGGFYEDNIYFDDFTLQDEFFVADEFFAGEDIVFDDPFVGGGEEENFFIEDTAPIVETIIGQTGAVRSTSVGGDMFIGNDLIELGVSRAGSFGTGHSAPADFHNPGRLSFVFDADRFDAGGAPATNDFFLPGTPEEGWSVGFRLSNGGATNVFSNFAQQNIRNVATDTTDISVSGTAAAQTTGTVDGRIDLTQKVEIGEGDTFFTTTLTLNNVTGSQLFDVRYLRSMDPDQEAVIQNEFRTINDVLSNPGAETGEAIVSAKGVNSGISLTLLADNISGDGIEARASAAGGLFHRDPYEFSHFETPADAGGSTANDAITFVFKVDSIAAGGTVTFNYITTVNSATLGNDFLIGGAAGDNLSGGLGNDQLRGLGGNDTLSGGNGNDTLKGGDGNDTLTVDSGNDALIGGGGIDTASYATATAGVSANLASATASDGGGGTDSLATIENLIGSAHTDTLTGDGQNNILDGGGSTDTLIGGAGDDTLNGGEGSDVASYLTSTAGVTVNLNTGTASDGLGGTDTLSSIELVVGSNLNDSITSGDTAVTFSGELGNDTLSGGAEGDHLKGDGGNDTLTGNGGVDTLAGGSGNDTYIFGETSDIELITDSGGTNDVAVIQAGTIGRLALDPAMLEVSRDGGNLSIEEREGSFNGRDVAVSIEDYFTTGTIETAIFNSVGATQFTFTTSATAGNDFVVLDGASSTFAGGGGADIIYYTSAINANLNGDAGNDFLMGAAGNDVLTGNDGDDRLFGGAGIDTLNGDSGVDGNDTLEGGTGNDALNGGGGNDTYIISSGDGVDTIADTGGATDTLFLNNDVDYPETVSFSGATLILTFRASNDSIFGPSISNHTTGGQVEQISVEADGGGTEIVALSATGLVATAGSDLMVGSATIDTLAGGLGNDVLFGNGGDDDLQGGGGNDFLAGGADNDLLDGGAGFDFADYATATAGITVDLANASLQVIGGGMGNDTLSNIEGVRGSRFADTITGDGNDNTLNGGDGDDVLAGAAGNDSYLFSNFDGSGIISITDTGGTDELIFGRADETKLPTDFSFTRSGNNLVISHEVGTPGSENATIVNHFTTNTVENFGFSELSSTVFGFSATATSGNDLLIGDLTVAVTADGGLGEDIVVGGNSADSLAGGAGNDFLNGGGGNDQLNGGAGNDEMDGDAGNDTLSGGLGDDIYIFQLESGDTSPADTISDTGGTDRIEILSTLNMSNALRSGNDLIFTFDSTGSATILDHYNGKAVELAEFQALFTDPLIVSTGDSGGIGDDFLAGTSAADTLAGGDGDDFMFANAGNDVLLGGFGADRMHGGAGADIFRFTATGEGTATTSDTAVTLDSNLHNSLEDFATGTDSIELVNSAFNLAGSLVNNTNFASLGVAYNGTNSGITSGVSHLIVDVNGTVYHDSDSATAGFTVVAETSGSNPVIGDFSLV
ncbi:MAG: hypothetical protein HOI02_06685 [Rhodospirillaceae bacterium]|nr:hypothetical protein [Rhodospirillaceae bacterium]